MSYTTNKEAEIKEVAIANSIVDVRSRQLFDDINRLKSMIKDAPPEKQKEIKEILGKLQEAV